MKAFLDSTFAGSPFLWYSGVHFYAVIRITRNICNIVKDTRRLIVKKYLDVVRKAAHVSRMIGEPKEMSDLVAEYGKIVPSSSKWSESDFNSDSDSDSDSVLESEEPLTCLGQKSKYPVNQNITLTIGVIREILCAPDPDPSLEPCCTEGLKGCNFTGQQCWEH